MKGEKWKILGPILLFFSLSLIIKGCCGEFLFEELNEYRLDSEKWKLEGNAKRVEDKIFLLEEKEIGGGGVIRMSDPYDRKSLQLMVEFSIRSKNRDSIGGKGLAIWFTTSPPPDGPLFSLSSRWEGVGIFLNSEINTFNTNHENSFLNFPSISIHQSNHTIKSNFQKINSIVGQNYPQINDYNTLKSFCHVDFRGQSLSRISIRFFKGILQVYTDVQGKGGWRECASFPFNQNYQPKKGSVEDQTITQPLYITISASNGDLSNRIDNYIIKSIKVEEILEKETIKEREKASNQISRELSKLLGKVNQTFVDFRNNFVRTQRTSLELLSPILISHYSITTGLEELRIKNNKTQEIVMGIKENLPKIHQKLIGKNTSIFSNVDRISISFQKIDSLLNLKPPTIIIEEKLVDEETAPLIMSIIILFIIFVICVCTLFYCTLFSKSKTKEHSLPVSRW